MCFSASLILLNISEVQLFVANLIPVPSARHWEVEGR